MKIGIIFLVREYKKDKEISFVMTSCENGQKKIHNFQKIIKGN